MLLADSTGHVTRSTSIRLGCGVEVDVMIRDHVSHDRVDVHVLGDSDLPFYGSGPSLRHALAELEAEILEMRDFLERNKDRLGPIPIRQLHALRHLFRPVKFGRQAFATPSFLVGSGDTHPRPASA